MESDQGLRQNANREISRRVLDLLRNYVGHGPTDARTMIAGDLVVIVLADSLTKGERILAEGEEARLVREMRRTFMQTVTAEIAKIVADEVGSDVATCLTDHSVLPDYAFVACVLERRTMEPELSHGPEDPAEPGEAPDPALFEAQRRITRGMVSVYKEFIGRGPEDAKTYIDGGVVASLLGRSLTRAEQVLADDERPATVRELRRDFQEALEERASKLVEDALGRPVAAFMSDHSIFPDYALEVFLLEPEYG